MAKVNTNSKKGFTIIEVVLVLAIAGLIFLMVFIALPSMQRGQRDTQRRNDMSRFISQLSQYQANNGGKVPTADKKGYNKFITEYLLLGEGSGDYDPKAATNTKDSFSDPSTKDAYSVVKVEVLKAGNSEISNPNEEGAQMGNITVYTNATCDGEDVKYTQGNNRIAIKMKLESAGWYCGHN